MLSEAYQRVATLQLGSNCCSFIAIFTALSSATLYSERALSIRVRVTVKVRFRVSVKARSHFCVAELSAAKIAIKLQQLLPRHWEWSFATLRYAKVWTSL